MPIYEYRCQHCGARFDKLVPLSAADRPVTCPECGTPDARKQFSTFATTGTSRSSSSDASCAPAGGG